MEEKKTKKGIFIICVLAVIVICVLILFITDAVIIINGKEEVEICYGEEYKDKGARVIFNLASPTTSGSVDENTIGSYEIKYTFLFAEKTRTVRVSDLKAPDIKLNGPETIYLMPGDTYKEYGYTAYDEIDKDLTDKVATDAAELDTSEEGTYYVTYIVSDSNGNAARERRKVCITNSGPLTMGLKEFDLSPYYSDIICRETEYDEEKYNQITFVGDSFIGNYAYYGHASWRNTWTRPSVSTDSILDTPMYLFGNLQDGVMFFDGLDEYEPEVLLFLLNCDWTGRWSAEYLMDSCDRFYGLLKENYPDKKVIICSLLPVSEQFNSEDWVSSMGYNRNERINSMNVYMCELCRKYGYKFMDAQSAFRDPDTGACLDKYISGDNIHITISGNGYLAEYIKHHLDF